MEQNQNSPFIVYPQSSIPVQPTTPSPANLGVPVQPIQQPTASQPPAPQNGLPSDLQILEQQRQQLLQNMQTVLQQEQVVGQELDQIGSQAQTIEAQKKQITQQLDQLNKQESAWYSKNSERFSALTKAVPPTPANPTQPIQTAAQPVSTPQPSVAPQPVTAQAQDQRLTFIRQAVLEKLMVVPPQGISKEEVTQFTAPGSAIYLSPDLNGIFLVNGPAQLHVPSADLIAAGALVDLTALPKYQQ